MDPIQRAQVSLLDPVLEKLRKLLEEAKDMIEKLSQWDRCMLCIVLSMTKCERCNVKFQQLFRSMAKCSRISTLPSNYKGTAFQNAW